MSTRVLVAYTDGAGLPRAWASGEAWNVEAVRERARAELLNYVTKRRAIYGETWMDAADFTREEHEVTP